MAMNLVKLPTGKPNLQLRVSKGHYATSHSHINYYIDVTLTKSGYTNMNAHQTIYVVTPEHTTGSQLLFRENTAPMIAGKHVLVLAASVTTGFTVQGAIEAIRYYGGEPVGIASIFASVKECAGYPVASIFDTHDLPDYETYDSHSCPWCKQGKRIDALVNSFGYSSL